MKLFKKILILVYVGIQDTRFFNSYKLFSREYNFSYSYWIFYAYSLLNGALKWAQSASARVRGRGLLSAKGAQSPIQETWARELVACQSLKERGVCFGFGPGTTRSRCLYGHRPCQARAHRRWSPELRHAATRSPGTCPWWLHGKFSTYIYELSLLSNRNGAPSESALIGPGDGYFVPYLRAACWSTHV
jgi:hypothetical protein